MKKRIKMKIMVIALLLIVTLAAPIAIPFTGNVTVAEGASVKISKTKLSMEIGAIKKLKLSGTKNKISWKSNKKKVATVTSKGVVTAQSAGKAIITATVNKRKYTCSVTVKEPINPYQINALFQEVQMAGLSCVVPSVYEVTTEKMSKNSYKAIMKLPHSRSNITVIANITGEETTSYEDIAASLKTLSEEELQAAYDKNYGKGASEVSELANFDYNSQNGTISYCYSFLLTTPTAVARTISYNLSVDGYYIEVIVVDEGYDIYIDAEYLIDSLAYLAE
ncbi:MAG: Ig-like domain-containing protein [Velocimicrobium sp.]